MTINETYTTIFDYFKYVVKILMGGVDEWFDQLDEKRVSLDNYGQYGLNTPAHGRGSSRSTLSSKY